MGTSDRLYELCCECRDTEEALERLRREAQRLEAVRRAALELAEAVEEDRQAGLLPPLSDRAAGALAGLRALT